MKGDENADRGRSRQQRFHGNTQAWCACPPVVSLASVDAGTVEPEFLHGREEVDRVVVQSEVFFGPAVTVAWPTTVLAALDNANEALARCWRFAGLLLGTAAYAHDEAHWIEENPSFVGSSPLSDFDAGHANATRRMVRQVRSVSVRNSHADFRQAVDRGRSSAAIA
jgi:hypothetical protein